MTAFWLKQVLLALWLEWSYSKTRALIKSVVFALVVMLFVGVFVGVVAGFSLTNTTVQQITETNNAKAQQRVGNSVQDKQSDSAAYNVSPWLAKWGEKLHAWVGAGAARPKPTDTAPTMDELTRSTTKRLENMGPQRLHVFTDNPHSWPVEMRGPIETMFGPLTVVSEQQYVDNHQRPDTVFVGTAMVDGKRVWWERKSTSLYGWKKPYRGQLDILEEFIEEAGRMEQERYLWHVKHSEAYTSLPQWGKPYALVQFAKIDVRALSLFMVLGMFAVPAFAAAAQAITWDFNRNKNIYEPYATMKAPVWSVLLKESLSRFWHVFVLVMCVAVIGGMFVDHSGYYVGYLLTFVALGSGVCWANLQLNMFFVITFQSPVGRQLARLLVMPFVFIPYHLFRVFGIGQMVQIVGGKTLEEFSWWVFALLAVACWMGGWGILLFAAHRVGKYRKGFAPT